MDGSIIASRTPEGEPNRCPLCGNSVILEPSLPLGDAPCPHCGQLLWFVRAAGDTRVFIGPDSALARQQILEAIAARMGIPEERLADVKSLTDLARVMMEQSTDSLDMIELIMELEEEFPDLSSETFRD